MRLNWTRRATLDLAEIRAYIARDNPPAASRVAARIRQAADRLTDHPSLGRPGREPGTRELVVGRTRYIVAYSVEDEVSSSAHDRRSLLRSAGGSPVAAGAVAGGLSARPLHAAHHEALTQTVATQAAITPQRALALLQEGNARFVAAKMLKRDLMQPVKATGAVSSRSRRSSAASTRGRPTS